MALLDLVRPEVDATLDRLAKAKFRVDPLVGETRSLSTSVVSSAYKRHGTILEKAILERLRMEDRYEVWQDPRLAVCQAANQATDHYMDDEDGALGVQFPYSDPGVRTLQVDLIVFDKETGIISSYEIKRGAGVHDAGKKRSIKRDLLCLQFLLRSYGEQTLERECTDARSKIIIYYGAEKIGKTFTLTREDLDDHFDVKMRDDIELVNEYFRAGIEALLEE